MMSIAFQFPISVQTKITLGNLPFLEIFYPFDKNNNHSVCCYNYGEDPFDDNNSNTYYIRNNRRKLNPELVPNVVTSYETKKLTDLGTSMMHLCNPILDSSSYESDGAVCMVFNSDQFFQYYDIDTVLQRGYNLILDNEFRIWRSTEETMMYIFGKDYTSEYNDPIYKIKSEFNALYNEIVAAKNETTSNVNYYI